MSDWEHLKMIKEQVERLMRKPLIFYHFINRIEWDDILDLEKQLNNSSYIQDEVGKNIPVDIFLDIQDAFLEALEKKRNWFFHSNIRFQTFLQLGKLGTVTSTEIAEKIGKNPKSVSVYLREFLDENLIEKIEDEDTRTRRYKFTEKGMQFYSIGKEDGWFAQKSIVTAHTILKIEFVTIHHRKDTSEYFTKDASSLINEVNAIAKAFVEQLKLTVKVPSLSEFFFAKENFKPLVLYIMVGSINVDELAIIFAAFNHLEHHQHLRSGQDTGFAFIHRLMVISSEFYFTNSSVSEDDFLSPKETRAFISKTLSAFREKYKING